jgi:hypothetical protein
MEAFLEVTKASLLDLGATQKKLEARAEHYNWVLHVKATCARCPAGLGLQCMWSP